MHKFQDSEGRAYCPFCGQPVGQHKNDCYIRMIAHNFRNTYNAHSKMYTGEELMEAWNRRAPVATEGFFIIPKPEKPILTRVVEFGTGKMTVNPQMNNLVSYFVKLQEWAVSRVLIKALAEAYGWEVKDKDEK